MKRLYFVVPVQGRERLAHICLHQLKRTCRLIAKYDIDATAVVVGQGSLLAYARTLGFATVQRDNDQLGRKFNDGIQLACDPDINPHPADYAVPCGSDDWIDPAIFRVLPKPDEIGVFKQLAVVNEDRTRLARVTVPYPAGSGIRILPRQLLGQAGYRPAQEDRNAGVDGSMLAGLSTPRTPRLRVLDVHPLQIVDWKSRGLQLHSYRELRVYRGGETSDVFAELVGVYPASALADMRALA